MNPEEFDVTGRDYVRSFLLLVFENIRKKKALVALYKSLQLYYPGKSFRNSIPLIFRKTYFCGVRQST